MSSSMNSSEAIVEDDGSAPRWVFGLVALAIVSIGIAAWLILRRAPDTGPTPLPTSVATAVQVDTRPRADDHAPAPLRGVDGPIAAQPLPPAVEIRDSLGLSAAQVVGGLSKYVVKTDVSSTKDGKPHRVAWLKGGGETRGQIIMIGDPSDLWGVAMTLTFPDEDRAGRIRSFAAASVFMDNVVPEFSTRRQWLTNALVEIEANILGRPLAVIGDKRIRAVGIPLEDGFMVAICLSSQAGFAADEALDQALPAPR